MPSKWNGQNMLKYFSGEASLSLGLLDRSFKLSLEMNEQSPTLVLSQYTLGIQMLNNEICFLCQWIAIFLHAHPSVSTVLAIPVPLSGISNTLSSPLTFLGFSNCRTYAWLRKNSLEHCSSSLARAFLMTQCPY